MRLGVRAVAPPSVAVSHFAFVGPLARLLVHGPAPFGPPARAGVSHWTTAWAAGRSEGSLAQMPRLLTDRPSLVCKLSVTRTPSGQSSIANLR